MRKGQSSIIDAFFFLMVCSSAATLMIYTAGLYGSNTTSQMAMVYNFEYSSNALIALHYAQEENTGGYFWKGLEKALADGSVQNYLNIGAGRSVWDDFIKSSPSSKTVLMFQGSSTIYCLEDEDVVYCEDATDFADRKYPSNVYTSSVGLTDDNDESWLVVLQLYY